MSKSITSVGRLLRASRPSVVTLMLALPGIVAGAEQAPLQTILPESSTLLTPAEAYADKAKPSITILVTAKGQHWLEKRFLEQGASKQKSVQIAGGQTDELEKALVMLSEGNRELQIYILADRDSRFQNYVDILKVLRQLNFSRISILATDAPKRQ